MTEFKITDLRSVFEFFSRGGTDLGYGGRHVCGSRQIFHWTEFFVSGIVALTLGKKQSAGNHFANLKFQAKMLIESAGTPVFYKKRVSQTFEEHMMTIDGFSLASCAHENHSRENRRSGELFFAQILYPKAVWKLHSDVHSALHRIAVGPCINTGVRVFARELHSDDLFPQHVTIERGCPLVLVAQDGVKPWQHDQRLFTPPEESGTLVQNLDDFVEDLKNRTVAFLNTTLATLHAHFPELPTLDCRDDPAEFLEKSAYWREVQWNGIHLTSQTSAKRNHPPRDKKYRSGPYWFWSSRAVRKL
jgi:hypothetical protein